MKGYHLDSHPSANAASEHFAIVRIPRRKRDRCPESNVTIVPSKEEALSQADIGNSIYAARVIGPARSSEGCNVFYLLEVFE